MRRSYLLCDKMDATKNTNTTSLDVSTASRDSSNWREQMISPLTFVDPHPLINLLKDLPSVEEMFVSRCGCKSSSILQDQSPWTQLFSPCGPVAGSAALEPGPAGWRPVSTHRQCAYWTAHRSISRLFGLLDCYLTFWSIGPPMDYYWIYNYIKLTLLDSLFGLLLDCLDYWLIVLLDLQLH